MSAFAKLAAEALVTPEQLEERAKKDRWKKWLMLAGGVAAAGGAAYGVHKNWDGIKGWMDKNMGGAGELPGLATRAVKATTGLDMPWAGAAAGVGLGSRRPALALGSKESLRGAILDGGEHMGSRIEGLDKLVEHKPATNGAAPTTKSMGELLAESRVDKAHPLNQVLGWRNQAGAGKTIQLNGQHIDAAKLHGALKNVRTTSITGKSNGRPGLRAALGAAAGWGVQQLDTALTGN